MTRTLIAAGLSFCLIAVLALPLWPAIWAGYPGDSFWTLGWGGRIGVLAISIAGFVLIFGAIGWAARQLPAGRGWSIVAVLGGLVDYSILFSVSPQVYYSFYQFIFSDLPQQWVINGIFDVARIAAAIDLRSPGTLSDDIAGIGFWALIPFTLWCRSR